MSESDKSNLGKVRGQWLHVLETWRRLENRYPDIDWEALRVLWESRYQVQSNMENKAAWILDPQNLHVEFLPTEHNAVIAFLKSKYNGPVIEDFDRKFARDYWTWRNGAEWHDNSTVNNPAEYWLVGQGNGSLVGYVARRLFMCLANSVPSERSFSSQNHIHSGQRSRLLQERVDKLVFIYYNHRVLVKETKSWETMSEGQVQELEDDLFAAMQG